MFQSWLFYVSPFKVHLELAPDFHHLTSEGFDKLKVSNALRFEVLTEILTYLGITCKQNQTPALSPVHLLAISQVRSQVLTCHYYQAAKLNSKVTVKQEGARHCLVSWNDFYINKLYQHSFITFHFLNYFGF